MFDGAHPEARGSLALLVSALQKARNSVREG